MAQRHAEQPMVPAAITRLHALSPLDDCAVRALHLAVERPRRMRAKREFVAEGQELTETLLVLSGWAARQRILEDGRRQIVDFLLPGDLIGACDYDRPVSSLSVIALTELDVCVAPDAAISPALARAYALSRGYGEAHLAAQVVRLGRMNAQDRIADLFLEFMERLERAGLAANGRFAMPLIQEVIADAVGLTSVHVNRSLQTLRREGVIDMRGRELVLSNPEGLRRHLGRVAPRVALA